MIGYRDVNSGANYQADNPAVYATWRVQSGSALNILTLAAAATKVTQGQANLPVSMQVENTGETAAIIGADSIGIQFLNNNNAVTITSPLLPDTLAAGANRIYNFNVTIGASAATGIHSLRGFVFGRNISTGSISSTTSAYLDGWNVQTPADLVITRVYNANAQVNSGQQDLSVQLRLVNQGQATAILDSAGIFGIPAGNISDSLLIASLADSIISGGRDTVLFNVDVSPAYTGNLDLDGFVNYHDGNDISRFSSDSGAVTTHTWNVGTQGLLVVDSVFTDRETMTLGQSGVTVRAAVRNGGAASVQIDSLSMLFNGSKSHSVLSATRRLPTNLPLLSSGQSFIAEFNLSAASAPSDSGDIELDLAAYGTDGITGSLVDTLSSEQPDSITLQTPAVLQVVSILNPASVLRGDNDVADTLIIRNSGGATARISDITINFKNGNTYYNREITSPAFPFDLSGHSTDTVYAQVDVSTATPLGTDSLAGAITGVEVNRGVSVNTTSAYLSSWQVGGEGSVSILRVASTKNQLSAGQDSVAVTVRISNQGSTLTRVDSLDLQFANGDTNYTVTGPVLGSGINLAAGADTTFSFMVDVNASALSGPDTVDARLVATEVLTSNPFVINGAVNPYTWLVQDRPVVAMDSVTISPVIASAGQRGLSGRVIITNAAGAYRATARLDSVDINFLLSGSNVDTNFTISRITPPTLPFMLPAGQSQAIEFDVDVNANAVDTTYTVDGAISYVDVNDNERTAVTSADQTDQLDVQSTANVNILSLVMIPDTVSQGQSGVSGTMIYENTGSASLQVNNAQLFTTPTAIDFISSLVEKNTPFTVPGNTTDTLTYTITTPTSLIGDVYSTVL